MSEIMDSPLELTDAEIVRMTGYRRPGKQIEMLKSLGIPARKRLDNSVFVLRAHCLYPVAAGYTLAQDKPKLRAVSRKK